MLDNQITPESQFNIDNFIIRTYINVLRTPINYTTLGTKFFKNPLLTYYIARNYNEDGTCRKSQRWSELGAKLVYISRLIIIAVVNLDSRLARKEGRPEINLEERFFRLFNQTLSFSTDKVYKELYRIYINIRRYNFTIKSTNNQITEIDQNNFIIEDTKIDISSLRDLIEIITNRVEDRLFNKLLLFRFESGSLQGIPIKIETLSDNIQFITPNTSFNDLPTFLPYKDIYLKGAYSRGSPVNRYFYPDNPPNPSERKFNTTRVKEYNKNKNLFIKDLLLLTYLTMGAPSRGTELTLIRYISLEGSGRNIYLDPLTKQIILNLR